MTAYSMKPKFTNREGYLRWRSEWRGAYKTLSHEILERKRALKVLQRSGDEKAPKAQNALQHYRNTAWKMMTLLGEAKLRRDRIKEMIAQIAAQNAEFPLNLGLCKNVDFHYNKGSAEWGDILPMWVVKAKGRNFYLKEVEANANWTTKERASGNTKGVLRFSRCEITIDENACATIMNPTVP